MVNTLPYYSIRVFWIWVYTHLYQCVAFFFNVSFYVTFHFTLMDTFQHLLKDRPSGNEFPELLFAWESVHLTSFLKDCFAGWSTLDRPFFSFSPLNISFHSLLACEISAEKSTGKIMGFPCKLQALFFLLLLRFSLWFFTYYMQYVLERISVSWFCQMAYEHHELGCSTLT